MKHHEEWVIAYRNRNNNTLLIDDQREPFQCIQNTWRYWCADPHLFENNGHTYVFAELYDRILRRGVIGCCELSDAGCSKWQVVLSEPYHLSYPHVFEYNGEVYMIPESYVAAEISIYRSTFFPYKWEKVKVLKDSCVAVDSTFFSDQHGCWILTLESEKSGEYLRIYKISDGILSKHPHIVAHNSNQVRPAGNFFLHNGKLLRPAQDCSDSYGCALNFYQVTKLDEREYSEKLVKKITPSMIHSNFHHKIHGIHTYNLSGKYEIIDLKYRKIDLWFYLMRPVWYLVRRIKNLWKG